MLLGTTQGYAGYETSSIADRLGTGHPGYAYGTNIANNIGSGPLYFATYFQSSMAGLEYANQRWHSPGMGRFLTTDPSGASFRVVDPSAGNQYTYGHSDPVNSLDPSGLVDYGLPPLTTGPNAECVSGIVNVLQSANMTFDQFLQSPAGILGVTSFFEYEGPFNPEPEVYDQTSIDVWTDIDWTFLNRANLSFAARGLFYGRNPPSNFADLVTGPTGSQVWSNGTLKSGFQSQLYNILAGSPNSDQCTQLVDSFITAAGVVAGDGFPEFSFVPPIFDTVPGALQFASGSSVPGHRLGVTESPVATAGGFTFYAPVYSPPKRIPSPRPPKGGTLR